MASTSRGKGSRSGRGAGARAKRATGGTKKPAARARSTAKGRGAGRSAPRAAAKSKSRAAASSARKPARPVAKSSAARAGGNAEVAKLKARFEREKSGLEKRLTETVREIGQLRHHEARVGQLERQLKERDETITKLRGQLSELRSRPTAAAVDDPELQPSLALGERAPRDLDDFDDEIPIDDDDELV